jgi:hypothetical protein
VFVYLTLFFRSAGKFVKAADFEVLPGACTVDCASILTDEGL